MRMDSNTQNFVHGVGQEQLIQMDFRGCAAGVGASSLKNKNIASIKNSVGNPAINLPCGDDL